MNQSVSIPKKVFVVPAEVFALLDPLEKIVIRDQERRGEVQIVRTSTGTVP